MQEIDEILQSYHLNTLFDMAEAAGLDVRPAGKRMNKAQLLAKMKEEFFTEKRVRASLDQLNRQDRAVLGVLLSHTGPVPTNSFRRQVVRAGVAQKAPESDASRSRFYSSGAPYAGNTYSGDPRRVRSPIFEDVIARLTYRGLVFSRVQVLTSGNTPYKVQFHPGNVIYIPQAIRRYLPTPDPTRSAVQGWQPARVEVGMPMLLLRDLYLYWDFARQNAVTFIQSGLIGKRSLNQINSCLIVPDSRLNDATKEDQAIRLYMLRQLLETLGLAHQHLNQLFPSNGDLLLLPKFWQETLFKQLLACLDAWSRIDSGDLLGGNSAYLEPDYYRARAAFVKVMRTLPKEEWIGIDDLLDRLLAENINFLFSGHGRIESGSYYSYHYGSVSRDRDTLLAKLEAFETEFIRHCLADFFVQIGAVDLGYEGEALQAFRLTPLGEGLLAPQTTEYEILETSGKLIVQPSFQILAMGPVSTSTLAHLDLFAEREQADVAAFAYRLTRESVYRAQQAGMDGAEVVRFLEEHGDTPLPQNVRRSLEEWLFHQERIVFRSGVGLLQAAGEDLLARLREDERIAAFLGSQVTPEVALVEGKAAQKNLVDALVGQGLFPVVSGPQPESADRGAVFRADGTVDTVHAAPSIYLNARLSRLADRSGDGRWVVTRGSVRRAGGTKRKLLWVIEEMGRLHRGTLSDTLVEQVKAWGNYYGNARVETLTLLEFRDQDTLAELTARPDLADKLVPFAADNRALAVVSAGNLPAVVGILDQLGVEVVEGVRY